MLTVVARQVWALPRMLSAACHNCTSAQQAGHNDATASTSASTRRGLTGAMPGLDSSSGTCCPGAICHGSGGGCRRTSAVWRMAFGAASSSTTECACTPILSSATFILWTVMSRGRFLICGGSGHRGTCGQCQSISSCTPSQDGVVSVACVICAERVMHVHWLVWVCTGLAASDVVGL
jgi:hypothetical protein